MSRYIDADLAIKDAETIDPKYIEAINSYKSFINAQPTADVRENVKGRWLYGRIWWTCSQCKKEIYTVDHKPFNFCPHCGADMRGDNK